MNKYNWKGNKHGSESLREIQALKNEIKEYHIQVHFLICDRLDKLYEALVSQELDLIVKEVEEHGGTERTLSDEFLRIANWMLEKKGLIIGDVYRVWENYVVEFFKR